MKRIDDDEIPEYINDLDQVDDMFDSKSLSPQECISSLFPTLDVEYITQLLASFSYDLSATIDYLLNNTNFVAEPEKQRQVCRHFITTGCYRKDCWFSHDLNSKICKYWLQGYCSKGDSCQFMHGQQIIEHSNSNLDSQSPVPQSTNLNTFDFPSLPSNASASTFRNTLNTSKDIEFNFNYPRSYQSTQNSNSRPVANSSKISKVKIQDLGWVSTGDTLASSYLKHRKDAIDVAIERNKLFQKATESYLSGNKALAKKFSTEAQILNNELQGLNTIASERIFEERNQQDGVIDLHGLHVDEIPKFLEKRLSARKTCKIVTGTGHHSRLGRAAIEPLIEDILRKGGYRWAKGKMQDGRGGIFTVYF